MSALNTLTLTSLATGQDANYDFGLGGVASFEASSLGNTILRRDDGAMIDIIRESPEWVKSRHNQAEYYRQRPWL